jgi:hypothetical protein
MSPFAGKGDFMAARIRVTIGGLICGLLLIAAAHAQPDIDRFDPLLKTSWYGIYMPPASGGQGVKIGYAKIALEKIGDPSVAWRMTTAMTIGMSAGGDSMGMSIEDVRNYAVPSGEMESSVMIVSGPTGNIEVRGQRRDSQYGVTTNVGGQLTEKEFAYPLDYLDSVLCLEMRVLRGKLKAGDSLQFAYFEATPPLTGLVRQSVRIAGTEEYLFNGVPTDVFVADITIQEIGITTQSRMDKFGNMLEGTFGGAMTLKLEDEATAKQLDRSFDILGDNIVKVNRPIEEQAKIERLRLRIGGINASFALTTNMQEVTEETGDGFVLELKKQKVPGRPVSIENMPRGRHPMPISSPARDELESALMTEPYIQSDDPKIIVLAEQIVGGEKDSWVAAKKINAWVFENIEKRFTADLSNALQTLNSRRGDCGEHTALAVALLRAAGIPARPIVGLIYWPPGGGFGYHAWVEAYVGEWVQMDPSWGEDLANPARIAIARGDIIAQVGALMEIMGRINIEVVEAE